MGLLDNPTSGYFLDGKGSRQSERKRPYECAKGNIGFVFQSFNLIDELNVFENIELRWLIWRFRLTNGSVGWMKSCNGWTSTIVQTLSAAVVRWSAATWPLPVLWFPDRRLFWPTSRLVTWIPRTDRKWWNCWPNSIRKDNYCDGDTQPARCLCQSCD